MSEKKNQKPNWMIKRLLGSYRFNAVDRGSLSEDVIIQFRGYQLLIFVFYFFLFVSIAVFMLTAYGPLHQMLPQTAVSKQKQLIELIISVDSLKKELLLKNQYIVVVDKILNGEVVDSFSLDSNISYDSFDDFDLRPSKADSTLRNMVQEADFYNIIQPPKSETGSLEDFIFFKPVDGLLTNYFNSSDGHFGVDIVTSLNAPIKSCLDGVVIFADWSASNGHTILIQHVDNIISVYMHNSMLTKKSNDLVKAGEVIGVVGNSGELSSGPHLHFELWQNGSPIDPVEYINF